MDHDASQGPEGDEDEPEPLELDKLAAASPPCEEQPEPDEVLKKSEEETASDLASRDGSANDRQQREDADAAVKAAAALAQPAAEVAKAAAEEAMAEEERQAEEPRADFKGPTAEEDRQAEKWLQARGSTAAPVPPPPEDLPMLDGAGNRPSEAPSALRSLSQRSPPLPPPPWPAGEVQHPLPRGHHIVLRGLLDNPSFNGRGGVVEMFDEADQAYMVRVNGVESLVKVGFNNVSRTDTAEDFQLPSLSLALPVQEDSCSMSEEKKLLGSRNSEVDTLHSLHFTPGSLPARILLSYCRQVAKRPWKLTAVYVICVLVPLIVGIIFRGFQLETDFNAFIKADGAAMRDREAFMLAYTDKQDLGGRRLHEVPLQRLFQVDGEWVEEEDEELDEAKLRTLRRRLKQEHGSNETSAPGRRLKTLFLRKEFELLYRAPGSILEEKALQEVQSIETGLRNLKGFRRLCEERITADVKRFLCDPGQSIAALAFPSKSSGEGHIYFKLAFDGLSREMLAPAAFLAYMKTSFDGGDQSRSNLRFFPKTFAYPEIGTDIEDLDDPPNAVRTKYSFHLVLGVSGDPYQQIAANIETTKAEWTSLINEELLPYFKDMNNRGDKVVEFFYSSGEIDSIEINSTLVNDLLMAIGSILFVIFYLRMHTGTWLISISSFVIIFVSVPLAYIMTPAAKATIASFLSVFLITGIGCDVVFVFTDFWEQAKKLPVESRLMWMIVHAGESCLATSITTALSFFANLASALQPLREFGMFMGLSVMCAFLLVLLMLPPLLVVVERQRARVKTRVVDISSGQRGSLAVGQDAQANDAKKKGKDSVMQGLLFTLTGGIASCPRMVLLCTLIFFITAAVGVVSNAKLSTGVPEIFPSWHNQVASKEVLAEFATEAYLQHAAPTSGDVCRADTINGTNGAGCVLHWCQAGSQWSLTTTTTTSGARQVSCWRSPTLSRDGTDKLSLGYGTEMCSSVTVYSRVASVDSVASDEWSSTMIQALQDDLSASRFSSTSLQVSSLRPLVIENWETGKVQVTPLWHSGATVAYGPFPDQVVNNTASQNGTECATDVYRCPDGSELLRDTNCVFPSCPKVLCELHALCFEAQRFHCGFPDWKQLGTYSLGRRLEGRQLQTGPLASQSVSNALDVVVLWGIRSARSTPLVGPPSEFWSFDPNFEPSNPWAQRAIRDMCTDLPANLIIYQAKCWIHLFATYLSNQNLRFPSRNFDEDVIAWYYSNTIEAQAHLWFEDRKVIACKLQFWANVAVTVPSSEGLKYMELWDEYVTAKNRQAPVTANMAWHTASVWVRSEAEKAIVGSTIDTIIIATCSGWAGVFIFTFDFWLAVIVTCVVLVVITGLAFFIVCIMGWAIGPIEVISLVVFVGYSVTYALHIAHNYNQMLASDKDVLEAEEKARKKEMNRNLAKAARERAARGQLDDDAEDVADVQLSVDNIQVSPEDLHGPLLRKARTRVAVLHVGGATLSSALSTAGSSAFLLFCTLTIFVKLGAVVVAVTVLSILGAIVTLPAALMLVGPEPDAWYKRKAKQLWRMLTGGASEEGQPLLDDADAEEVKMLR